MYGSIGRCSREFLLVLILQVYICARGEPLFAAQESRLRYAESSFVALISNYNRDHLCTGTLITKNHVLTAATCLKAMTSLSDFQIILRAQDTNRQQNVFNVSYRITYEEWCSNIPYCFFEEHTDDIGILQLDVSDTGVTPAKFDFFAEYQKTAELKIVGWGATKYHLKPIAPRAGYLTILEDKVCEERVRKLVHPCLSEVVLSPKLLCVVADPPILGVYGDFGGPAYRKNSQGISGILIQRCPAHDTSDIKPNQVNLVLKLGAFSRFIEDVVGVA